MLKNILKRSLFVIDIVLLIILAFLFYYAKPLTLQSSVILIPKGSDRKIITKLYKDGIPLSSIDTFVLSLIGKPQSGWIDLKKRHLTRFDLLKRLTTSKAALVAVKIIPGETSYWVLKSSANRFGFSLKKLKSAYTKEAPYPEGVFFADTYLLPKGIKEEQFIDYLLKRGLLRHKSLCKRVFGHCDQKRWFERVVTIASIIQKEAANKEEMPLIASVIYNRLKIGMPLQMDGALNYGRFSHMKVTPKRIANDKSRFNTYRFKGLPPYPVCVVGLDAIKAALKPKKSSYLYFVKGANGQHIFSKSYNNHLKNIKGVKKRNKKN